MAGRFLVVAPKLIGLTSIATGGRRQSRLHCVDPETHVIGATSTEPSVVGHPLAGIHGTPHWQRNEYDPAEFGTFEFWPDRRKCTAGEAPSD